MKTKKSTAEKIAEKKAQFMQAARPVKEYYGEARAIREIAQSDFKQGLELENSEPDLALNHFRRAYKLLFTENQHLARL